jgi:hypothetical protein
MDRLEEARDALIDGLQFEPQDKVSPDVRSLRNIADRSGAKHFPGRVGREAEGGGIGHVLSAYELLEKAVQHMCAVDDCISHASLMQHYSSGSDCTHAEQICTKET